MTPTDHGCQALIAARLEAYGFSVEHMRFGDVDNLWARLGNTGPVLAFAGHTDVVPSGDENAWTHSPWSAKIDQGKLYGRGSADMKGSVAAMVTACERLAALGASGWNGSLAVLLTSDEEGPARDGTRRVMQTLVEREERIDYCLLGEPSSSARLGDVLRIGRRGSLGASLRIHGKQGHVAYPALADNPIHRAARFLNELVSIEWDQGDEHFPPTTLQVSNFHSGTGASNVIPGIATIDFNLRYGPATPADTIRSTVHKLLDAHQLTADIDWNDSAHPFITGQGALLDITREVIQETLGIEPEANTAGGTSDGRFIAPTGTQLLEFGPINATIHAVDEHVDCADLDALSHIYETVARRLLNPQDS